MILFLLLSLLLSSSPVHAQTVADCTVDNRNDYNPQNATSATRIPFSLRAQTERFNASANNGQCSAGIFLNTDVNLSHPLEFQNNSRSNELVIEGNSQQRTISLNGVSGACAVTLSRDRITLRDLKFVGARTNTAALCINANTVLLERVTFEDNFKGVVINGINTQVKASFFRRHQAAAIELQNAQNLVSWNGSLSNSFNEQNGASIVSPLTAITPRLNIAPVQPNARYRAVITFDPAQAAQAASVTRVDFYRKNNREVNNSNYIASATQFNAQTATIEFAGLSSDEVFAVASTSSSTSAPSQATILAQVSGNPGNGGNNGAPSSRCPITWANVPCVPGVIPPATQDLDCDYIPDVVEDSDHNCQTNFVTVNGVTFKETAYNDDDSDNDGLIDGFEDLNHNGRYDHAIGETDANIADSDLDGIPDGKEDVNQNGLWDQSTESNPRAQVIQVTFNGVTRAQAVGWDSDLDGIPDRLEDRNPNDPTSANNLNGRLDAGETSAFQADTDGDGLPDGVEDANQNGRVDIGESDPRNVNTDGDNRNDNEDPCPTDPSPYCREECDPLAANSNGNAAPGFIIPTTRNPFDPRGQFRIPEPAPIRANRLDSDRDGLYDNEEDWDGDCEAGDTETDRFDPDTDGDGLFDGLDPCPLNDDPSCVKECIVGRTPPSTYDADGDGIPNVQEDLDHNCIRNGNETDAFAIDTDNDGITDGVEKRVGLSPLRDDSDGDGLKDGEEDFFNQDGVVQPGETDPKKWDTDGDGVNDGVDQCPTNPDNTCTQECINGRIPPLQKDSDDDGLPDLIEDADHNCRVSAAETDLFNDDTDNDGIIDSLEDTNRNGMVDIGETDPRSPDSDSDQIPDGVEDFDKDGRHDPNECNPRSRDTDGDGIEDGIEDADKNGIYAQGIETSCYLADSDRDGLADNVEDKNLNGIVDLGESDPRLIDTDGDGALDGQDQNPVNSRTRDVDNVLGRERGGCSLQATSAVNGSLAWLGLAQLAAFAIFRRKKSR